MADTTQENTHIPGQHPDLPPPASTVGVIGWLRKNMFGGPTNIILTGIAIYIIWLLVPPILNWAFVSAVFGGSDRYVCEMGRTSSRLGTAIDTIDLQNLQDPASQKAIGESGQFLSQFTIAVTREGTAVPANLAAKLDGIDLNAVAGDLSASFKNGNIDAVKADYRTLQPIIDWGAGNDGACWTFIGVWFKQIIYGRYPDDQLWRINLAFVILIAAAIPLFIEGFRGKKPISVFLLIIFPIIAYFLFSGFDIEGGSNPLPSVETPLWGGLFLTLVIAGVGIVASLPIGIVLALGRRSNMPIVRALCVGFIELWRGVPLISVLFMASVMFPLFLPEGMNFDKLLRALIGVTLFSSAYMAEVVRGGLQAIPKGQYEAAQALGLTFWKSMSLIILPQALKLVIPGIVNTFIGLFKDTTLVLIIGLFDLLGMVQLAATNPDWLGFSTEGYVFAAFGFWIFCFCMSRYSQHIERKLHTGH